MVLTTFLRYHCPTLADTLTARTRQSISSLAAVDLIPVLSTARRIKPAAFHVAIYEVVSGYLCHCISPALAAIANKIAAPMAMVSMPLSMLRTPVQFFTGERVTNGPHPALRTDLLAACWEVSPGAPIVVTGIGLWRAMEKHFWRC